MWPNARLGIDTGFRRHVDKPPQRVHRIAINRFQRRFPLGFSRQTRAATRLTIKMTLQAAW
jgi:hypothetical protein